MERKTIISKDIVAERKAMEKSIKQTACLQKLFAGTEGEFGLKAIDEITGYEYNTFDKDPYKHAYVAGMRAVSVILREIMNRDVKLARKVLQEKENE